MESDDNISGRKAVVEIAGKVRSYLENVEEMYDSGIPGVVSQIKNPGYREDNDEPLYVEFPSYYQVVGVEELLENKRILNADEMGVGKTAQAVIAKPAIEEEEGRDIKSVVVCPDYAKKHWKEKIDEYLEEDQNVVRVDDYNNEEFKRSRDADFTLLNYPAFGYPELRDRLTDFFVDDGFDYLILDETHNVKNSESQRSQHIKSLSDNVEYLHLLSGTPLPDSLKDAYNLIAMLEPEAYKNAEEVKKKHWKNPRTIRNVLDRKRLKRNLDEVAEVPPLSYNVEEHEGSIEIDNKQRKLYDSILSNDSLKGTEKLFQLRHALLDPKLVDPGVIPDQDIREDLESISSAKYEELDEIIERSVEQGEKVVVYSPFRRTGVTDKLEERYEDHGALRIDGRVRPIENRPEIIDDFTNNEDNNVLVATPATAGESISLIEASKVVLLDEHYSPGVRRQMISRVRRRGQDEEVKVISLTAKDSVDEGILELLEDKQRGIDFLEKGKELTEKEREALKSGKDRPITDRMYTSHQKTRRQASRMFEKGYEKIKNYLERKEGKHGKEYVKNFMEDWENSYSANTARLYKEIIESVFDGREPEGIIDLGSGPGIVSHVTDYKTTNLDLNKYMFEHEVANFENNNVVGPIHDLHFDDGEFELAVSSLVLNYTSPEAEEGLSERESAIREANRALKEEGIYLVTLPRSCMSYEKDKIFRDGLSDAGFNVKPDLSGFARSKEEDFEVYVCTAEKEREPIDEEFGDKLSFHKIDKTPSERGLHGFGSDFEFVRKDD